jgi:hypothetical protein
MLDEVQQRSGSVRTKPAPARSTRCNAVQRARAEAQAVKFQQGPYLVLAKWNDVPKASLTALVRAIQKAVPTQ